MVLFIYSCHNKTESDNTNSLNNESTEEQFICESNIDVKSHDEGQFIGEFSGLEDGMWSSLKLLDNFNL